MITRTRYAVAYLPETSKDTSDPSSIEEVEIEVWGVDEMRAELEARRLGLRGPAGSSDGNVSDLGDMLNRQALDVWAALVRLGLYGGKSAAFRTEHCVGIEKLGDPKAPGDPVDPTQPEDSTTSG